jgi:hypothetical protein
MKSAGRLTGAFAATVATSTATTAAKANRRSESARAFYPFIVQPATGNFTSVNTSKLQRIFNNHPTKLDIEALKLL